MLSPKETFHCGLDFGTTNSSLATILNGQPQALTIDPNNSNPQILKSLIYVNPNHQIEIGQQAVQRYLWDVSHLPAKPPRLHFTGNFIKTFGPSSPGGVGKLIEVPEIIEIDDSGRGRLLQSLKSVLTSKNFSGTNLFGKCYSLEDLLGLLVSNIKTRAEKILGHPLTSVVLGRPVKYVGDKQQENLALTRMSQVARNAGFKNIKFEYEPVGAALAYGFNLTTSQTILVFDFGGGTLDVCLMSLPQKKILSVSGRPIGGDLINSYLIQNHLLHHLGQGVTISQRLDFPRSYLLAISSNWYQLTLNKNTAFLGSLENLIVKADNPKPIENLRNLIINDYGFSFFSQIDQTKINLSSNPKANFIFHQPQIIISQEITRKQFENNIKELVKDAKDSIIECLKNASLLPGQVDHVISTGGSSKIPIFQQMLRRLFPSSNFSFSDPYLAVAQGLALKAEEIFK
jgi:hypothetical chaperone protein